jgi:hypothetical protein
MAHLLKGRKKTERSDTRKDLIETRAKPAFGVESMVPVNVRAFNHSRKIPTDAKLSRMDGSDDPQSGRLSTKSRLFGLTRLSADALTAKTRAASSATGRSL